MDAFEKVMFFVHAFLRKYFEKLSFLLKNVHKLEKRDHNIRIVITITEVFIQYFTMSDLGLC